MSEINNILVDKVIQVVAGLGLSKIQSGLVTSIKPLKISIIEGKPDIEADYISVPSHLIKKEQEFDLKHSHRAPDGETNEKLTKIKIVIQEGLKVGDRVKLSQGGNIYAVLGVYNNEQR